MPKYETLTKLTVPLVDPALRPIASSEPVQIGELWFYGSIALLSQELSYSQFCIDCPVSTRENLEHVETMAESEVLDGKVLVCGVHTELHQRYSVVPLRWGASRIIVLPSGFRSWLGQRLDQELFPAARLWRYGFDPKCDLVVSLYPPDDRVVTRSQMDEADRLIVEIASQGELVVNQ